MYTFYITDVTPTCVNMSLWYIYYTTRGIYQCSVHFSLHQFNTLYIISYQI